MDNKNIFEKPKFTSKKLSFYVVAALCIALIGVLAFLSYRSMSAPETKAPDVSETPVDTEKTDVTEDIETEAPAPTVTEPTPEPEPAPEPEAPAPSVDVQSKAYVMPVKGEITVGFSLDTPMYSQTLGDWRIHDGIDIAADFGTEVVAVNDGVIEDISYDDLYGVSVIIKHTDGRKSTYSNLEDTVELEKGQIINQNDIVGVIGQTAVFEIADGPHLHFEMSENGKKIDPTAIIQQ